MPGVTISAGYGAGGSVVAPHVAKLLGLPLLDRAISSRVAAQLRVSVKEAEGGAARRSLPDRFISALVPLAAGVIATSTDTLPRDLAAPPGDGALFREQADAIMRAALVVRRGHPRARWRGGVPRRAGRPAGPAVRAARGAYRPGRPDREHRRGDRAAPAS